MVFLKHKMSKQIFAKAENNMLLLELESYSALFPQKVKYCFFLAYKIMMHIVAKSTGLDTSQS